MLQSFFHTITHWVTREMDQNKKYHLVDHHLLIKKTLQLVLPVSVASFLISYTCTRFSVFSSYRSMTTLVFPTLTHVFERKYMFLICNGILAFLMKTLNLNNSNSPSSYSLSDLDGHVDHHDSSSSALIPIVLSSSEDFEDAVDENDDHEEEEEEEGSATPGEVEDIEVEGDHEEVEELAEESFFSENVLGDFVIESEGFDMDYEEENVEEEYIGGEELMGEDDQQMEVMVNMNTEDLNRKFEEFIRKMKEELRIQEQQQWIIAV